MLASKPTLCQDSLECREFDAWLFKNLASLPLYIFPSFVDDYYTICLLNGGGRLSLGMYIHIVCCTMWNMAWLGIVLSSPMGSTFTSAVVLGKHTALQ